MTQDLWNEIQMSITNNFQEVFGVEWVTFGQENTSLEVERML